MYNYVVVWIICYGPYVVNATVSEFVFKNCSEDDCSDDNDRHRKLKGWFYLVRNLCLYAAGLLDLMVYGLANAWLKRSLRMACDRVRLTDLCCLENVQASYLKNTTDKVEAWLACAGGGGAVLTPLFPMLQHDVAVRDFRPGDSVGRPSANEQQELCDAETLEGRQVRRRCRGCRVPSVFTLSSLCPLASTRRRYLLYSQRPDLDSHRNLRDINAEYDREARLEWAEAQGQGRQPSNDLAFPGSPRW